MKNKTRWIFSIISALVLLTSNQLLAQIRLTNGGGTGYTQVRSYNGVIKENHYILQLDAFGENINISDWSIFVRINGPIRNSDGKTLDPSKVSLRLNNISGKNAPTIQQIGANTNKIPLSLADIPIILNSQYAIQTGNRDQNNKQIKFSFDIIIEGGSYLGLLKSWNNYNMDMVFTFRSNAVSPPPITNRLIEMQIYPNDTPPVEPTYSIQINSNARNGLLEFKTISDYVNGVSQTYQNGLSITSSTPYAVQVKSLSSNLQSNNNTLPINTVSVNIKDPNNSAIGGTIALSENTQTVFNAINNGTNARLFDIRYFTQPNDERLLNSKPDNYQTTLTYTLLPQ